jgi:hypothetical protein
MNEEDGMNVPAGWRFDLFRAIVLDKMLGLTQDETPSRLGTPATSSSDMVGFDESWN